jgi:hypothetical protein
LRHTIVSSCSRIPTTIQGTVREFTPSGVSAAEISHPGQGRGDASPKKALSIRWLERLADAGDFGMDSALVAQHEPADFELRSGGTDD